MYAHDYCCSIGMYLATLPDEAALLDYGAVRPSGKWSLDTISRSYPRHWNFSASSVYVFLDETYANGEGLDAWCSNHQTIPKAIVDLYAQPVCDTVSCILLDLKYNCLYIDKVCLRNNAANAVGYSVHFLCKWFNPQTHCIKGIGFVWDCVEIRGEIGAGSAGIKLLATF